jgi:hypothetical protein
MTTLAISGAGLRQQRRGRDFFQRRAAGGICSQSSAEIGSSPIMQLTYETGYLRARAARELLPASGSELMASGVRYFASSYPRVASQIWIVPPALAEASFCPSGLQAAQRAPASAT